MNDFLRMGVGDGGQELLHQGHNLSRFERVPVKFVHMRLQTAMLDVRHDDAEARRINKRVENFHHVGKRLELPQDLSFPAIEHEGVLRQDLDSYRLSILRETRFEDLSISAFAYELLDEIFSTDKFFFPGRIVRSRRSRSGIGHNARFRLLFELERFCKQLV